MPERSLAFSFACAWHGVLHALRTQRNMRIHIAFAVLAIVLGLVFRISLAEWLAISAFIALVLSLEILNTALEALVDLVSPERNEFARVAKDCAAGAVLVSAFVALVVGVALFAPRIIRVFFG